MKIGVIGAGKIGSTASRLFTAAGHEVWIANSRGPETLADLAAEVGATAATVEHAITEGNVLLVAIPLGHYPEIPAALVASKIVIDANNYYPRRDGHISELDDDSTTSSELLARHLPGARIVKAFNTIYFQHLAEQGDPNAARAKRRAILVSSDDAEAKSIVSDLIEQIGFAAVDMGSLAYGGRRQQPNAPLYNAPVTAAEAERLRDLP